MLPDIIDKPVGMLFFRDTFENGRIFSHTLLFLLLISGTGYLIYMKSRQTGLLAVSFGCLMHLILDEIWLSPRTFLWPVFGLTFEKRYSDSVGAWISDLAEAMVSRPSVYISEIIGGAILIWLAFWFIKYRMGLRGR